MYTSQLGLSLRLQASEDLVAALRAAGFGSPLARAVGVDTAVAFGGSCPAGVQIGAPDTGTGAAVCRDDAALRPPYWIPASAVTSVGEPGALPTAPQEAVVDAAAAVAGHVDAATAI